MAELLNVECDATQKALTEAGRPNCLIKLSDVSAENIGYLFQALEGTNRHLRLTLRCQRVQPTRRRGGQNITYERMGRPGY